MAIGAGPRFYLLGQLAIGPDGLAPPWAPLPGRRAELVFAYLVAEHHRSVSRDELADALWAGILPDSWAPALRGVVTEVRRFLAQGGLDPAEVLATERRGYRMRLPPGSVTDIDRLRSVIATAGECLVAGDAAEAARLAGEGAALARLPFLADHEGDWVDGLRRELSSLRARALEIETRASLAAGDGPAATAAAEQLVRADAFSEPAHLLRIQVMGALGDRPGAARAYEHYRHVLDTELGVAPSPEAEAELARALGDQAAPAPEPPGPAPAVPAPASAVADPAVPARAHLGSLSVLVVEDHDFQRRVALHILSGLGVGSLAEAGDGRAALDVLERGLRPDVVICDIDMPGMDGVEFIRIVAHEKLAGAVVIVSGLDAKVLAAVRSVSQAHGLEVLAVIEKPLTSRGLREALGPFAAGRASPDRAPEGSAVTAGDVRAALVAGQISPRYQPWVELGTGRPSGATVSPAWEHPVRGPVALDAGLPGLRRAGLAAELVTHVLRRSCRDVLGTPGGGIGQQVSAEITADSLVLASGDPADGLREVVVAEGRQPAQVTLAIGTGGVAGDPRILRDALLRLRVKGFGLAWRDRGTGWPGSDLDDLPFTRLDLDHDRVARATGDPAARAALADTIDRAHTSGMTVLDPACATQEELGLLLDLGCDRAAGPLIAPGMPAAELHRWARAWVPPTPWPA